MTDYENRGKSHLIRDTESPKYEDGELVAKFGLWAWYAELENTDHDF